MSDNSWTFAAAIAGVVSGWFSTRLSKLDHEVYERVALLERDRGTLKKSCLDLAEVVERLELDLKAANDEIEELKHK